MCVHLCVHVHTCLHVRACVLARACVYVRACMHACVRVHVYLQDMHQPMYQPALQLGNAGVATIELK